MINANTDFIITDKNEPGQLQQAVIQNIIISAEQLVPRTNNEAIQTLDKNLAPAEHMEQVQLMTSHYCNQLHGLNTIRGNKRNGANNA